MRKPALERIRMDNKQRLREEKKEQALLNYWAKARTFAALTIKYCGKFPPGFHYGIADHLVDDAREVYFLTLQANGVYINAKGKPEETIAQYKKRDEILVKALEALETFDADFELLMDAINIEADTLNMLRTILGHMAVEISNGRNPEIDVKYVIPGNLYFEGQGDDEGRLVRLRFSHSNRDNWLRKRDATEDAIKERISRDRQSCRKLDSRQNK